MPNPIMAEADRAFERPTIAIVGRPNVGKSTLFNRLTRSRAALVAGVPGLTRDPKVGIGRVGDAGYIVVDTGGIDEAAADALTAQVARQALATARDCDTVILVVDGQAGLNASDEWLAHALRGAGRRTVLAINKAEGRDPELMRAEFASLGLAASHAISAAHGAGVAGLMADTCAGWPSATSYADTGTEGRTRIAVIGRPNVGKSTLVNRILGHQRMLTSDVPGTTRDAVDSDFERAGRAYTIIDTAGLRRKARSQGVEEKFSAVQTLQALARAQVAVLVVDARDSITEQDLSLLGLILEAGRSLVIAVNKWDGLGEAERAQVRRDIDRRLRFAEFAELRTISALHGSGVGNLFEAIDAAADSAAAGHKTRDLTNLLQQAVTAHAPPLVRGRRIKLRYAHLGGRNPPTIVIHGNQVAEVPGSYRRYLENFFRERLALVGTPIALEFRQGSNPFAGRRNPLSERQVARKRRLMRHVKK